MKTQSVKRSRHGVLYYQEHSGRGWSARADIVQVLNPEGAGNMAEARELPFIIGRPTNREFPVGRFFPNEMLRRRESFGLIVFVSN